MDRQLRRELQKIAYTLGSDISPNVVKNGRNFAIVEGNDYSEIIISHTLEGHKTREAAQAVYRLLQKFDYFPSVPEFEENGMVLNVTIRYKKGN